MTQTTHDAPLVLRDDDPHTFKDGCTGCAICAIVCPYAAITVYREVPKTVPVTA